MTQYAWIFPGQGSQKVGMLSALAQKYSVVEKTFQEASQAIDIDLFKISQSGPDSDLNATHITQPALLTASVAIMRIWQQENGAKPAIMAGHSLGEYSALVCANAISFVDAVKLVHQRGLFMQQAVKAGEGLMAAVMGLSVEKMNSICEACQHKGVVQAANINSPAQIVLAGENDAVLEAIKEAKNAGAKRAIPLQVSAPSHCDLMRPAAEKLQKALESVEINSPDTAIIHNVDAKTHSHPDDIKAVLCEQLYKSVQWVACIQAIQEQGFKTYLEAGPGKVLAGLVKRIDSDATVQGLEDPAVLEAQLKG